VRVAPAERARPAVTPRTERYPRARRVATTRRAGGPTQPQSAAARRRLCARVGRPAPIATARRWAPSQSTA